MFVEAVGELGCSPEKTTQNIRDPVSCSQLVEFVILVSSVITTACINIKILHNQNIL